MWGRLGGIESTSLWEEGDDVLEDLVRENEKQEEVGEEEKEDEENGKRGYI